jgi:hypothetical protein
VAADAAAAPHRKLLGAKAADAATAAACKGWRCGWGGGGWGGGWGGYPGGWGGYPGGWGGGNSWSSASAAAQSGGWGWGGSSASAMASANSGGWGVRAGVGVGQQQGQRP